jgi:hypothetical protein
MTRTVTEIVDALIPQKDWVAIAKKHAKKHGNTPEHWTEKWTSKRNKSKEVGTILHSEIEQDIKKKGFEYEGSKLSVKFFEKTGGFPSGKLEDNSSYPEFSVCDKDFDVCGRIDNVFVKNKKIYITDSKTDETIDKKAFSNEWVKAEKLLQPCSHLDNCNYNIISLKMSLYMYLIWKQNPQYRIGDIILNHVILQRDEDGIPLLQDGKPIVLDIKPIKLSYRRDEVKKLL